MGEHLPMVHGTMCLTPSTTTKEREKGEGRLAKISWAW